MIYEIIEDFTSKQYKILRELIKLMFKFNIKYKGVASYESIMI